MKSIISDFTIRVKKNAYFDQSSPELSDHLTLLIVNRLKWSIEIGSKWSIATACPIMGNIRRYRILFF
jgi:hypothetical protein